MNLAVIQDQVRENLTHLWVSPIMSLVSPAQSSLGLYSSSSSSLFLIILIFIIIYLLLLYYYLFQLKKTL